MEPPPADREPRPSLAGQLRAAMTRPGGRAGGIAVAALLVAGPVATIGGAKLLTARASDAAAALARAQAPRLEAAAARAAARETLAPLLTRPMLGATLESVARTLPRNAALVRAGRGADGRLAIAVSAPDPDRLRAALRRGEATAMLRDAGQSAGEGGIVAAFEERR